MTARLRHNRRGVRRYTHGKCGICRKWDELDAMPRYTYEEGGECGWESHFHPACVTAYIENDPRPLMTNFHRAKP